MAQAVSVGRLALPVIQPSPRACPIFPSLSGRSFELILSSQGTAQILSRHHQSNVLNCIKR